MTIEEEVNQTIGIRLILKLQSKATKIFLVAFDYL